MIPLLIMLCMGVLMLGILCILTQSDNKRLRHELYKAWNDSIYYAQECLNRDIQIVSLNLAIAELKAENYNLHNTACYTFRWESDTKTADGMNPVPTETDGINAVPTEGDMVFRSKVSKNLSYETGGKVYRFKDAKERGILKEGESNHDERMF